MLWPPPEKVPGSVRAGIILHPTFIGPLFGTGPFVRVLLCVELHENRESGRVRGGNTVRRNTKTRVQASLALCW